MATTISQGEDLKVLGEAQLMLRSGEFRTHRNILYGSLARSAVAATDCVVGTGEICFSANPNVCIVLFRSVAEQLGMKLGVKRRDSLCRQSSLTSEAGYE